MIVVDASLIVEDLLAADPTRWTLLLRNHGDLHVPELTDVEVASALRRMVRAGELAPARAFEAVEDYVDLPLKRHAHAALIPRILELRDNFSAYDATYVALAEALGCRLATMDLRLERALSAHTPTLVVDLG